MRDAMKGIRSLLICLFVFGTFGTLQAQCGVAELRFTVDGEVVPDEEEICSSASFIGVAVRRDGSAIYENLDCTDDLGDLNFIWSMGEMGPCVFPNPNLPAPVSIDYSVTVTCSGGTLGTPNNELTIKVINIPDFNVVAGDCSGETISLSADGLQGVAGLSYSWTRNMTVVGTNSTLNVSIPESGNIATYSLEVDFEGSCSVIEAITLRGDDLRPDLTTTQSGNMACSGSTVTVSASSDSQAVTGFSWIRTSPGGASGDFVNGVANLGPGTYTISTEGAGCEATEQVIITEMPGPNSPELTGEIPANLCENETVTIGVEVVAGLTYSWRTLAGDVVSTATSFAVGPGALEVFAINADGCGSTPATINIGTVQGHTPSITASPQAPYCEGDLVTLTATNLRGATATWNTMEVGPSIMIESGDDYSVTYEGGDLCAASTNLVIPDFGEPPSLPLQPDASALSGNTTTIQLNLGSAAGVSVPLDSIETQNASVSEVGVIEGGLLFFEPTGTAGARSTGAIRFTLIPESLEGCVGPSQTLLVRVVPDVEEPFIPEIISPNGDGSNDQWSVVFPEDGSGYDVVVYSRGGAVVFEGSGSQMPWDAGPCPNGVYYYRITQRGPEGGQWQGALTIIGRQGR